MSKARKPLATLTAGAAQPVDQHRHLAEPGAQTPVGAHRSVTSATVMGDEPVARVGTVHAPKPTHTAKKAVTKNATEKPSAQGVKRGASERTASPSAKNLEGQNSSESEDTGEAPVANEEQRRTKRIVMGDLHPTSSVLVDHVSGARSTREITLASVAERIQLLVDADASRGPQAADATLAATQKLSGKVDELERTVSEMQESAPEASTLSQPEEAKMTTEIAHAQQPSKVESMLVSHLSEVPKLAVEVVTHAARTVNENYKYRMLLESQNHLVEDCHRSKQLREMNEKLENLIYGAAIVDMVRRVEIDVCESKMSPQTSPMRRTQPVQGSKSSRPLATSPVHPSAAIPNTQAISHDVVGEGVLLDHTGMLEDVATEDALEEEHVESSNHPKYTPLTLTDVDNVFISHLVQVLTYANITPATNLLGQRFYAETLCQLKDEKAKNRELERKLRNAERELERARAENALRFVEYAQLSEAARSGDMAKLEQKLASLIASTKSATTVLTTSDLQIPSSPRTQFVSSSSVDSHLSSISLNSAASPTKTRGQAIVEHTLRNTTRR